MRQIFVYNNAVNTIFMLSMCFVSVFSTQHQRQHQHQNGRDEDSSTFAAGRAAMLNDNANAQGTWQPMSPNNWIILKAAARQVTNDAVVAAAAATTTTSVIKAANNPRGTYSGNRNLPAFPSSSQQQQQQLNYKYWHKEQQAYPTSHLLTNYYNYNHNSSSSGSGRDGNYQPPTATDVKLIEPYIVTISKMRARSDSLSNTDAIFRRRIAHGTAKHAFGVATPYGGGIELPKDVESGVVAAPKIALRQDIEKKHNNSQQHKFAGSFDNTMKTSALVASGGSNGGGVNDDDGDADGMNNAENAQHDSIIDEMKADGAHLIEIFQPLQSTLDKVIAFCDMAKRFISDVHASDNDDDEEDDEDDKATNAANNESNHNNVDLAYTSNKPTAVKEVQGHHGLSIKTSTTSTSDFNTRRAQSRASTSLSSIGTGRKIKKLKKKLSKFILPLLLAYKLKFLTLIPVLIGGLTLLVGTTGLAGFFFALFTAVMSLKSTGGTKSIILKKL